MHFLLHHVNSISLFKRSPTLIHTPSKCTCFHPFHPRENSNVLTAFSLVICLQSRAVLLADYHILSSFLALIRNSTAEFQRFPNGTAVVQRLTRLELELQSMITVLMRLERILGFVSKRSSNYLFFMSIDKVAYGPSD